MRSLAVYAVVYPAVLRYFAAFWHSLAAQLDDDFVVYLSLDGVSDADVRSYLGAGQHVHFLSVARDAGPAEVRRGALERLTSEHDGVVLLDCDDLLLPGRLGAAREALSRCDVYGSALQIVDESGAPVVGAVLSTEWPLTSARLGAFLARTNIFGFSNTAYRSDILRQCIAVEPGTVIMDWLVASRAYLSGATFTFDTVPRMLYRQYGANTARVLPPFTPERVLTDARRVVNHFRFLLGAEHGSRCDVGPFLEARESATAFLAWLTVGAEPRPGDTASGHSNLTRYCESLNALSFRTYLWWEHVAAVPVYGPAASGQPEIIGWSPA